MVGKNFIVDSKKWERRKKTIIQHKLRVVLNCYTVTEFNMDEEARSFSFKKNYRINGRRIEDPKTLTGFYDAQPVGDNQYKLTIVVNT